MLNKMYLGLYIQGRNAKPLRHNFDAEKLGQEVILKGETPPVVAARAAEKAAARFTTDRYSKAWRLEHADEIAEAGGDEVEAYRHFLQGRTDELAGELDALICEQLEDTPDDADLEDDESDDDDVAGDNEDEED